MKTEFTYSKHALQQIERRKLNRDILEEVLQRPDTILEQEPDIHVYQKKITEGEKSYIYRVFVNKRKRPLLVVTAYRTSKLKKYED